MLPTEVKLPTTITEVKAKELTKLFTPMLEQMEQLEADYNEIVDMPIGKKTCELAKKLRLKYVKIRTGTKAIHKEAKAYHVAAGKAVDAFKNAQLFAGQGNEDKLKEIETFFERREAIKIETARASRMAVLLAIGIDYEPDGLGTMTEDLFEALKILTAKKIQDKADEEARIIQERKEADAKTLADREEKIRQDERDKIEAEAERKKAEDVKKRAEEFAKEFNITPPPGEPLEYAEEFIHEDDEDFGPTAEEALNNLPNQKKPTSFVGTGALTGDKKGSHANPDFKHATRAFDYNFKVTLRVVAATEEEADEMIREYIDGEENIIDSEEY